MELFDAFFPLGRTNGGLSESPCTQAQALQLMDSYGVKESFVFHTVSRDSDPELGNTAISDIATNKRLHRIWAFDSAYVIEETPEKFLERALLSKVKAILVNPLVRDIRLSRNQRIHALAEHLEKRHIPLLVTYRAWDKGEDIIDWYELADFCKMFPGLPVLAWEHRSRSNRPLFDALAEASNLRISISCIWQAQIVAQICKTFGAQSIVFSLGLPLLDPGAFIPVLSYADISKEAKNDLAGENIRRIIAEADYGI